MTSERRRDEAYVWAWLPDAADPVVAGRLDREGDELVFEYAGSYLEREAAIPLYLPELPLRAGAIFPSEFHPESNLKLAGCLRDGAPDAWGRRVILNRLTGTKGAAAETDLLDEMTYLLESASDRIGALDFQHSSTSYSPRQTRAATLDELLSAADLVERGVSLPEDLHHALMHGSSIGGARPKASMEDEDRKMIAKFSTSSDSYEVVKAEFIAMRLAREAGMDVAEVELRRSLGRDVMLVKRFDRFKADGRWRRRMMVSALTILGLSEDFPQYASYEDLAKQICARFTMPTDTLHELFKRLVFNVLCGNTDDHARNHAAFWDGTHLTLTPAYDICPQPRTGNVASQAMLIKGRSNLSSLATCLEAAPNFKLGERAANAIVAEMLAVVRARWKDVCEEAELPEVAEGLLWGRAFLNPSIFEDSDHE